VCFSAAASFTVGAALLPAGVYCIAAALRKKPSYSALAVVPLLFGIQQISEGFVWHSLHHEPDSVRDWSLVFLFFALAFWPFWFSVVGALMESHPQRRSIFVASASITTVWFWILYFPLLAGDPSLLDTHVAEHSIQYDYHTLPVYDYISRPVLQLLYLSSVAVPMAFGTESWGRIPGLVLGASAVFSALVFEYAFVSVWCFFAAMLALYLCLVFYRLQQRREPTPTIQ
jgi:hypothetical protein